MHFVPNITEDEGFQYGFKNDFEGLTKFQTVLYLRSYTAEIRKSGIIFSEYRDRQRQLASISHKLAIIPTYYVIYILFPVCLRAAICLITISRPRTAALRNTKQTYSHEARPVQGFYLIAFSPSYLLRQSPTKTFAAN